MIKRDYFFLYNMEIAGSGFLVIKSCVPHLFPFRTEK